ncbi:MAG: hypothetical protein K1X53_14955 [Candidatus Sumerlaeaceae bacterium]|nr:hypothetical protein [Candidatus Sumerlaeaceae bacterium]
MDPSKPLPENGKELDPDSDAVAGEPAGGKPAWLVRLVWVCVIAVCLIIPWVWYHGSHVTAGWPSEAELKNGPISQVVMWRDGKHTAVQFSRLYDGNPDHFWKVVTDQGRFDEFMPFVAYTRVRPGPNGTRLEEQKLNLPFGDQELELEITLTEEGPVRMARWRQSKGTLRHNEGAWIVEKGSEGKVILRYQVSATVDYILQWVTNFAMRQRLGKLLDAVDARVKSLKASDPDYFSRPIDIETTGTNPR